MLPALTESVSVRVAVGLGGAIAVSGKGVIEASPVGVSEGDGRVGEGVSDGVAVGGA